MLQNTEKKLTKLNAPQSKDRMIYVPQGARPIAIVINNISVENTTQFRIYGLLKGLEDFNKNDLLKIFDMNDEINFSYYNPSEHKGNIEMYEAFCVSTDGSDGVDKAEFYLIFDREKVEF